MLLPFRFLCEPGPDAHKTARFLLLPGTVDNVSGVANAVVVHQTVKENKIISKLVVKRFKWVLQ